MRVDASGPPARRRAPARSENKAGASPGCGMQICVPTGHIAVPLTEHCASLWANYPYPCQSASAWDYFPRAESQTSVRLAPGLSSTGIVLRLAPRSVVGGSHQQKGFHMRFGMSGAFLPASMDDFTPEMARRIRDLGYSGCFTRFTDDPFTTAPARANRVRDLLAEHGLRMYQAIGYRPPLIHPDETVRTNAVRTLAAAVRLTKELGCRGTHTGPGSLNPRGAWFPHPYNWTTQAKDQLIKSLREVAPVAEECGVYIGMEGHLLVTLDCAETMAEVLGAVNSPFVRCDLDPVNWITRETVFDTGPAIDHMVKVLGSFIIGGHAKDVIIEDRLVLHISECSAGTGILDWDTFLPHIEALDPDAPLVVEHCTTEELGPISEFLHEKATELGITVRK